MREITKEKETHVDEVSIRLPDVCCMNCGKILSFFMFRTKAIIVKLCIILQTPTLGKIY